MARSSALYDDDFYAWSEEQAALLRAGKVAEADLAHIAEEIESMGRTEKRELVSRLTVLLTHLLKWQFQPELRGRSWRLSIEVQRLDIEDHLKDNPSLKHLLDEAVGSAYLRARILAGKESGLDPVAFPTSCPFGFERMMDAQFWPD